LALNTYLHRKNKAGEPSGPVQRAWLRLVQKYAEMHVPTWLRVYSFRDGFSIRCPREGPARASLKIRSAARWATAERCTR